MSRKFWFIAVLIVLSVFAIIVVIVGVNINSKEVTKLQKNNNYNISSIVLTNKDNMYFLNQNNLYRTRGSGAEEVIGTRVVNPNIINGSIISYVNQTNRVIKTIQYDTNTNQNKEFPNISLIFKPTSTYVFVKPVREFIAGYFTESGTQLNIPTILSAFASYKDYLVLQPDEPGESINEITFFNVSKNKEEHKVPFSTKATNIWFSNDYFGYLENNELHVWNDEFEVKTIYLPTQAGLLSQEYNGKMMFIELSFESEKDGIISNIAKVSELSLNNMETKFLKNIQLPDDIISQFEKDPLGKDFSQTYYDTNKDSLYVIFEKKLYQAEGIHEK